MVRHSGARSHGWRGQRTNRAQRSPATNPLHTNPPGGLTAYYENNVIGGPCAFVVEAQGFEAFGQLLIGKLRQSAPQAPRG